MDGAEGDAWSAVAGDWSELWGGFAAPVQREIVAATCIESGSRVLDIGCGSGEFLALIASLGGIPHGIDPAPSMIGLARSRVAGADIRIGSAEALPWPDDAFQVATAVNSIQFADDLLKALAEAVRVVVPRGFVAIANWAEGDRNDLNAVEAAVADAADEQLTSDGDLRLPGGLEALLRSGGLEVSAAGVVEAAWEVPDDDTLVRGVLMGEDAAGMAASAQTMIAAARPFRTAGGGYRLVNAFRFAVGRTPGPSPDATGHR